MEASAKLSPPDRAARPESRQVAGETTLQAWGPGLLHLAAEASRLRGCTLVREEVKIQVVLAHWSPPDLTARS